MPIHFNGATKRIMKNGSCYSVKKYTPPQSVPVVTDSYHTYEYLGDQTLLRDDGLKMKCTSLTGAVFTFKQDPSLYTAENMADFEETIFMSSISLDGETSARKSVTIYRSDRTDTYDVMKLYDTYNGKYSGYFDWGILDTDNSSSSSYSLSHLVFGVSDTTLTDPGYNVLNSIGLITSENAVNFYSGPGLGLTGSEVYLSGTTLKKVGATNSWTWGYTNTYREGYSLPVNWFYTGDEMLTGSIDQILSHFDYNNGGTWVTVP